MIPRNFIFYKFTKIFNKKSRAQLRKCSYFFQTPQLQITWKTRSKLKRESFKQYRVIFRVNAQLKCNLDSRFFKITSFFSLYLFSTTSSSPPSLKMILLLLLSQTSTFHFSQIIFAWVYLIKLKTNEFIFLFIFDTIYVGWTLADYFLPSPEESQRQRPPFYLIQNLTEDFVNQI